MANEKKRVMKRVSIEQVKLKKAGDSIEGFIRQINTVEMSKGPATELVVETDAGVIRSCILGVSAAKAVNLRTVGEYLKVTLEGTEKTLSGNNVNKYVVEVGEES